MATTDLTELHTQVAALNEGIAIADHEPGDPNWFRHQIASVLDSLITAVETLSSNVITLRN